jgi:acetyl-CoA C-acetyltransferase
MIKVVIAGAARTPMGGFQGALSGLTAPALGGAAMKAALAGHGSMDEVLMGCVLPAGLGQAPARQAGFMAGRKCPRDDAEQDVWIRDEGGDDRV